MKVRVTSDNQFLRFHGIEKDCCYYAVKTSDGCVVTSDIGEEIELHNADFIESEASE